MMLCRTRIVRRLAVALVAALVAAGCSLTSSDGGGDLLAEDTGDCIVVDLAVSSEKIELLTELARTFNDSDAEVGGRCVFARPLRKASGGAMQLLVGGWDEEVEGPRPVIWSPAASTWGPILNSRLEAQGRDPMAGEGRPFMLTPLVIAMPRPMAEALGWPDASLGFADILELALDDDGWAAEGRPEWGPFRLGKTNPNFSTSGLAALIAQTYAATGKTSGLSLEDLANPRTIEFGTGVESAVVHYGDTTLTFLNNWYRADQRGSALSYASAAAVEEKSVIDYNAGNPDGVLDPGEVARPPRIPLVAIYPEEGTLYSDNPFYILDAEWVDDDEKAAAGLFRDFVQEPENQEQVLRFGFRPGNPSVAIGEPIIAENGVDPDQPQTLLEVPSSRVMVELLDRWAEQRKGARVVLLVDVSGSMGDLADPSTGETKLDLAKRAAIDALDEFKSNDLVGLTIFTTDEQINELIIEVIEPDRIGSIRGELASAIEGLFPQAGTPLYSAIEQTYRSALDGYDSERINAVIVLSDGRNDDGLPSDDLDQFDQLIAAASAGSEGQLSRPVRVFPIAYGADADLGVLRQIAEATSSAVYDAGDPRSIEKVFAEVVSNF